MDIRDYIDVMKYRDEKVVTKEKYVKQKIPFRVEAVVKPFAKYSGHIIAPREWMGKTVVMYLKEDEKNVTE